jgi:hypothetical protein
MSDKHATFKSGKGLRQSTILPGLNGAVAEILEAALKGLEAGAHDVMDLSQERVPVLDPAQETHDRPSGELRDTAEVQMLPTSKRAALKYGTAYAAYQHERMDLKHPTGGQAKFLESSMLEKAEHVAETVAAHVREVTGG